jgi:DNA polymerase-1
MQSYEEVTMKKKLNFREVELVAASIYSGEDVYITHKLFQKQNKEKTSQDKILQEIEIPLIEVLKNMELDGVKIDRDRLKSIGALLENEIQKLEKEILNEA